MRMLLIALTVLSTASAFAKTATEYYFQPAGGASALELTYEKGNATIKFDPVGESKREIADIRLDYAYGLSDNAAVGFYTFTGENKLKSGGGTQKADGMGDLHAYYKGISDSFYYGADLGFNTEKFKSDNRSTGGPSLKVNGGYLANSGSVNYGGDLSYLYKMERTTDSTPAVKATGGDILRLALFGEYNYGSGFLGGEVASNSVGEAKFKQSGTTTTGKSSSNTSLKFYGTYDFSQMVQGLAFIENQMFPKSTAAGNKAYTATLLSLGARINF